MNILDEYYERGTCPPITISKSIAFSILDDITGTRGLSHEWDMIEQEIQIDILNEWIQTIERIMK